ncbi:MAG TPA: HdeD family acid-resistance protein, partial [Dongiaceae bacterium]
MTFETHSNASGNDPAERPVERMTGVLLPFARIWWLVVLRGVAGIVFGLFAIFLPDVAVATMLFVFAAYMLVDGIFGLAAAVTAARRGRRWGLLVVEAILTLLAGIVALIWPALTAAVLVLLIAVWALITGAMMIGAAFQHGPHGQGWLIFSGIVSMLFGFALAVAPMIGAVVLTWWLGIYALVFGVLL